MKAHSGGPAEPEPGYAEAGNARFGETTGNDGGQDRLRNASRP